MGKGNDLVNEMLNFQEDILCKMDFVTEAAIQLDDHDWGLLTMQEMIEHAKEKSEAFRKRAGEGRA